VLVCGLAPQTSVQDQLFEPTVPQEQSHYWLLHYRSSYQEICVMKYLKTCKFTRKSLASC